MRLRDWRSDRRDVELDPATGKARYVPLPEPRADPFPLQGFATFERSLGGARVPFALYRAGDNLFFSAAERRWDLTDPGLTFSHRRFGFLSRFRVLASARVTFSFWYLHVGRSVLEIVDPTSDALTRDTDFFLRFVAQNATSHTWQHEVRKRWG